ncbi:MAG TPA: metalloregulator ArsR/SmtB family transcription factor [Dehalococcoidia bacterium]|nr:metalloregulator ArsR/SmtB family transcription factor [Dehalococcoidia bacterium]
MAKADDDKFKALAHPLRRALLSEMKDGDQRLAYLVRRTGASPSRISNHLKLMGQAQLVRARRTGKGRVYQLRKEGLQQVLAFLNGLID